MSLPLRLPGAPGEAGPSAPRPATALAAGPGRRFDRIVAAAALAAGGLLAGIVFLANRFGVAVSPDSAHYLSAAANLARGRGLLVTQVQPDAASSAVPFAGWPPLYPALVAVAHRAGLDLFGAAVLVNALSLAVMALATAGLASRAAGRNAALAVLIALAGLPALAHLSAFAWSEPAFMAFSYAALWLLSEALATRKRGREMGFLAGAGVAIALASATRYMGLVLAAAAMLAFLVFHSGRTFRRQLGGLVLLSLPAALFSAGWFLRNLSLSGLAAGQPRVPPQYDFPGICAAMAGHLLRSAAGEWAGAVGPSAPATVAAAGGLAAGAQAGWSRLPWLLPAAIPALLILGSGILLVTLALRGRILRVRFERLEPGMSSILPLSLFALVYCGGVAVLGSQLHRIDEPDLRWLAPVWPALLALGAAGIQFSVNPGARLPALPRGRRLLLGLGSALLAGLLWSGTGHFLLADRGVPEGRLDSCWRTRVWAQPYPDGRAALAWLGGDRSDAAGAVWTNVPEFVDLVGGRPARRLPLSGEPGAVELLARHPGPVLVDTRYQRGLMTRGELLRLAEEPAGLAARDNRAGPGVVVTFLGDVGRVALFRVTPRSGRGT